MEIVGSVEASIDGKIISTTGNMGESITPEKVVAKAIQILQDAHLLESQMNLTQFKRITLTQGKENFVISLKKVEGNDVVVITRITM